MPLLYALEYLVMVFLVIMVITQMIMPALRDRPLFPWFRSKPRELKEKLDQIREEVETTDLEAEIADKAIKAKKSRRQLEQQKVQAELTDAETEAKVFETQMDTASVRRGQDRCKKSP